MAYALSIDEIKTVKEQINDELVAKAYLLTDSMFEDLGIKVTTDVENIDVCYIFNRKGLIARPYVVGNVKSSQLGKLVDNPAKVEPYYAHASDSIERYREKGPFNAANAADEAKVTTFNLNVLSGSVAESVRANFFFGNKANRSLADTADNQVKLGLSLFDGIYTIIAKRITDGTISAANGNLIITGAMPTGDDKAKKAYEMLTAFYGALNPAMKKPEVTTYIYATDEFCRLVVKGYMETFPQIAPTVLQAGWKFAEMPNIVLKTSSAMGKGAQLIATVGDTLEFICDTRENAAKIRIGQVQMDLTLFDYQVNAAATTRIRDFDPQVFACNEQLNTPFDIPAGQYVADVFTVTSSDEKEGTVAIAGGQKDLYADGDIITVQATAEDGYKFVGWSNGEAANPLNYKFPGGRVNLVAMFEEEDSSH